MGWGQPVRVMNTDAPAQVTPANLNAFVFAGNAVFTVRSAKTETRFTFLVEGSEDRKAFFVSVLNGSDNTSDFGFIGTLFPDNRVFRHSLRKSTISPQAPSAVAAKWVCERIANALPLNNCELWHEGKCGRCGRRLTVPESIETGLGPECAKHV